MSLPEIRPLSQFKGSIDIGLITFRDDEFGAILERFPPRWLIVDAERQYNITVLKTARNQDFHIAVVRTIEQGHRDAQATAQALINDLDPSWLIIVGIAGAKPESEFCLGDVLVGTRVNDFSITADLPGGHKQTSMSSETTHLIVASAMANLRAASGLLGAWNAEASIGRSYPPVSMDDTNFFGDDAWNSKIRESLMRRFPQQSSVRLPLVTSATIGSGNTLMKDPVSFQAWLEFARDLKAVEMETPGVFSAAASTRGNRPVLAIRGISDLVGYKRDSGWTEYACHSAASFCKALLTSGILHIQQKPKKIEEEYYGDNVGAVKLVDGRGSTAGSRYVAILERTIPHPKLVDIAIDRPNGGPDDFILRTPLSFGLASESDNVFHAEIGVTRASLLYTAIGCHPMADTRFGEKPKRPGVSVEGARWVFTQPKDESGILRGDPFHGDILARMQRDGDELPQVSIVVQCDDEADLRIVVRRPQGRQSRNQKLVAERFLAKCYRESDGTVRLGAVSLMWKAAV